MATETCLRQMFKTKAPFPKQRTGVLNSNCHISNRDALILTMQLRAEAQRRLN